MPSAPGDAPRPVDIEWESNSQSDQAIRAHMDGQALIQPTAGTMVASPDGTAKLRNAYSIERVECHEESSNTHET